MKQVVKLVDALDLGASGQAKGVQVSLPAPHFASATLRMAQPRTEQLQEVVSCEANSEVGR